MIKFKKNGDKILPYNRKEYIQYLSDENDLQSQWKGVSFQLPGVFEGKDIGLKKFIEVYEDWVTCIISGFEDESLWVVNHDRKGFSWFPNEENNLISLRKLFKENDIPNSFRGSLILSMNDLIKFSRDLISYPYAVFDEEGLLYTDLDISHVKVPIIIKISAHLNIDLLSTDEELLMTMIAKSRSDIFVIKEYRGTSLKLG